MNDAHMKKSISLQINVTTNENNELSQNWYYHKSLPLILKFEHTSLQSFVRNFPVLQIPNKVVLVVYKKQNNVNAFVYERGRVLAMCSGVCRLVTF